MGWLSLEYLQLQGIKNVCCLFLHASGTHNPYRNVIQLTKSVEHNSQKVKKTWVSIHQINKCDTYVQ